MKLKTIISSIFAMSFIINNVLAAPIASVKDMPIGWSRDAVSFAVENDILDATDGYVRPTDLLTRAELALGINNIFDTKDKADLSQYTDVSKDKWYYDEMAKAVELGLFSGYGNGLIKPEKNITREELLTAIYNVLQFEKGDAKVLEKFNDRIYIGWSEDIIARMVENNYIAGNLKGNIKPQAPITREEFAQIMKNIFGNFYNESGEYSDFEAENIVISEGGVTLKDVVINNDLIIADGVGTGDIILDNVTIKGKILLRSGETLKLLNKSKVNDRITIEDSKYKVNVISEDSEVKNIYSKTDTSLEGDFRRLYIVEGGKVELKGNIDIAVVAKSAEIAVPTGTVQNILVNPTAPKTKISGKGKVVEVVANADDTVVLTEGTKVTAGVNTTGVKAGTKDVKAGSSESVKKSSSSGGSSSGGGGSCKHTWQTQTAATCTTAEIEVCSKCKKTRNGDVALGHDYKVTTNATCTEAKVETCSKCSDTKTVGEALGHDFVESKAATCTEAKIETCSRCPEARIIGEALGHDWNGENICTRCETSKSDICEHDFVESKAATCTEAKIETCSRCPETRTVGEALGHDFNEEKAATCTEAKVEKCSRCPETRAVGEALGHDFVESKAATCTEAKIETCSRCPETRIIGEALGHDWNGENICTRCETSKSDICEHDFVESKAATCTEAKVEKCSKCPETRTVGEALGHDFVESKAATCTEAKIETCSRCPEQKIGEALGHDFVETISATCTVAKIETCSRCPEQKIGEALGHDYQETSKATCTEAKIETCSKCPETRTVGEALGHDFVESKAATCTEAKVEICSRCPEQKIGEALGHDFVESKAATCTEAKVEICNRCSETKIVGEALGHSYNEDDLCTRCLKTRQENCSHNWQTVSEATCILGKVETCSECNAIRTGEPNGHSYNEDEICTICGASKKGDCTHEFEEVSPANCTTQQVLQCKICDMIKPGLASTGHNFVLKLSASCEIAELQVCDNPNCNASRSIGEPLGHNYQVTTEATCTVAKVEICSNCKDRIIGEALGHDWKDTLVTCTTDGYSICSRCDEFKKGKSALGHENGEYVEETCEVAGYWKCVRYEVCKHTEVNPEDPAKHLMVYTAASCLKAGFDTCSRCGEVAENEEDPALGHDITTTEATCTEDGLDECNRCNYEKVLTKLGHDITTTEATCTEDGLDECSRCDYEKVLTALGHDIATTEATCTENGLDECSRCDYEKVLTALGHENGEYIEETCETAGYWKCVRYEACKHTEENPEDPAKHKMEYTQATCTKAGFDKCSVCGEIEVDSEAPALGHENGEYVEETCTTAGYWKCVRYEACKHTEENPEDPATHIMEYTAATCTVDGFNTCSRCGEIEVDSEAPALGHENGEYVEETCEVAGYWKCVRYEACKHTEENPEDPATHIIVTTEATCTEDGLDKCSRCGYEKVLTVLGHDIITTEATCTEDGLDECNRCDYEKVLAKLGHEWSITAATCTQDGIKICDRCGLSETLTALEHTWGDWQEAKCETAKLRICGVCKITETEGTANGHSYNASGICTVCGKEMSQNACKHTWKVTTEVTCTTSAIETCILCKSTRDGESPDGHNMVLETEATCLKAQVNKCSNKGCEERETVGEPKGHTWTDVAATCTTSAYRTCACGEREDIGSSLGHIFDEDDICTGCGKSRQDLCSHNSYETLSPATCTAAEVEYCTECVNEQRSGDPALGHDYQLTTVATCASLGIETCTRCGETRNIGKSTGHDWVITSPASCASAERQTCSRCQKVQTVGDVPDHTWMVKKEPTCILAGEKSCIVCGMTEPGEPANGHTYEITTAPTCGAVGVKTCIIEGCGVTNSTDPDMKALGHDFQFYANATCTTPKLSQCVREGCGEFRTDSAALGHTKGECTLNTGCTGISTYNCSVCGNSFSVTNPGHNPQKYASATCTAPEKWKCSNQGCTYEYTKGTAKGHSQGTKYAATCQEPAYYICSRSDCKQKVYTGTSTVGHNWQTLNEATCTTDEIEYCATTGCGITKVGDVKASGHTFSDGICQNCSQPQICIITFDVETNGGTLADGSNATEDVDNGKTFAGTLPEATKEGCTFSGWYTAATEGELFDVNTVLTNHITLYAQFTETVSE